MADKHPIKSINPDNLDNLGGTHIELSQFTGEKPDAWIEDDSKTKLAEVNTLLDTGTEEAKALIKSLGDYLKTVGETFKLSDDAIAQGIESNGT